MTSNTWLSEPDSEARHGSVNSPVTFDEESQDHTDDNGQHDAYLSADGQQDLRRRRSSMGMRLNALRQAGGVNSLENFARSWQRAAGFAEVAPIRNSFRLEDEEDDDTADPEHAPRRESRAQLRQQLLDHGPGDMDAVEEEEDDLPTAKPLTNNRTFSDDYREALAREEQPLLRNPSSATRPDDIFNIAPSLASPFGGSYGTTWGSLSSRVNEPSMRHAGRLFRQQQQKGTTEPDKERQPILVKQVHDDDGKVVNVVVGQSTLYQTMFNSVNVLIGVGLLALPLALRMTGWIPGMIFMVFAGGVTCYTAKILAKCADVDNSLITFADLAYVSFGPSARVATSILFCLELIAACVALVVLFADSLDALIPGWGNTEWKLVCGVILIPLAFVPLRFLSFTSILGIVSCFGITAMILIDGLIKPQAPGSLRDPAVTHLFPQNWLTMPIGFGILMSPWGGHSVFPNIYRDMRHPYKYRKAVNATYSFTFGLDILMAVIGLLMFGDGVKDEITRNVLTTDGYPHIINILIVVAIAVIPITKIPLNGRPIVATLELFLGLDPRGMAQTDSLTGLSGLTRGILKITIRILTVVLFIILAILVPQFDTIMSLLGAVACFTVCIILPCAFHLKLFYKELTFWQRTVDWVLIVSSTVLAIVATAFNFIPKDKLAPHGI